MMPSLPSLLFAQQEGFYYYHKDSKAHRDQETPARARQDFVLAVIESALKILGNYEEEDEEDDTNPQSNSLVVPQ